MNTENQDAVLYEENDKIEFGAVADGVSSCRKSGDGARFAVELLRDILTKDCDYIFSLNEEKASYILADFLQRSLKEYAYKNGVKATEYSSTLSFTCRNKKTGRLMTFSLGDSRVYGVKNGSVICLDVCKLGASPSCSSMTEGAQECSSVAFFEDGDFDGYLIASDGAWRLMFSDDERSKKYKKLIAEEKIEQLKKEFEKEINNDDCSFVYMKPC